MSLCVSGVCKAIGCWSMVASLTNLVPVKWSRNLDLRAGRLTSLMLRVCRVRVCRETRIWWSRGAAACGGRALRARSCLRSEPHAPPTPARRTHPPAYLQYRANRLNAQHPAARIIKTLKTLITLIACHDFHTLRCFLRYQLT